MTVYRLLALLLLAHASLTATGAGAAPVPREQLLVPPADAAHRVVVSDAGTHGDMWRWTLPDGRLAYRHSQSLRGWISETDQVVTLGPDGHPVGIVVRGITPNGDAPRPSPAAAPRLGGITLEPLISGRGRGEGKTRLGPFRTW
jgi:hypothetical protein